MRRQLVWLVLVVLMLLMGSVVVSAQTVEKIGDVGQIAIPATALAVTALKGDGNGSLELIGSVLVTAAVVQTLKATVDATRPNGGKHSFPSGHTAISFAGASFLQKRYGWRYGVPAYAAAATVGWTRVESRNHYLRDVAVGALIGTGVSQLLTKPIGKLHITPTFSDGGIGFSASIDFNK